MSYLATTATSPIDLLQQLEAWLVSLGWTMDLNAADGSGWRAHLHKGTNHVHLRAAMNESLLGSVAGYGIGIYLSTSFSGSQPWGAQPGAPPFQNGTTTVLAAVMTLASGAVPGAYFFADGSADNIVVVTEKTAGVFSHLGWGASLAKSGAWTGGAYFFASVGLASFGLSSAAPGSNLSAYCPGGDSDWTNCAAAFVRVDVDAFSGKWVGISPTLGGSSGYTGKIGESSVFTSTPPNHDLARYAGGSSGTYLQARATSVMNAEASLLPVLLFAERDSGGFSLLGSLPSIYFSNGVGSGFAAAALYPLGAQNFVMFPNFAVLKV